MKHLIISLLLTALTVQNSFTVPFPFPKPQNNDQEELEAKDESKIQSLCQDQKFDEFLDELQLCERKASVVVDEALAGSGGVNDIKRAICQVSFKKCSMKPILKIQ